MIPMDLLFHQMFYFDLKFFHENSNLNFFIYFFFICKRFTNIFHFNLSSIFNLGNFGPYFFYLRVKVTWTFLELSLISSDFSESESPILLANIVKLPSFEKVLNSFSCYLKSELESNFPSIKNLIFLNLSFISLQNCKHTSSIFSFPLQR